MNIKTFAGGYKFKNFQGQVKDELISLDIPPRVIMPLYQGFSSSLDPAVKVGDRVYAGQIITKEHNKISSPVHSSINGKVVGIEKKNYFKREVAMVTIEGDGKPDYQGIQGHNSRWEKLSAEDIEKVLYASGVTCLDREGIPTRFKTSIIPPQDVSELIIHVVGSEVYNVSLDVLLSGKNLLNFVTGIKILRKIMPKAKVHLAFNKDKKQIIESIRKLTADLDNLDIHSLVAKYPQGYDEILVPTLLNKKFPYGYSAANIGIVVLNLQAVLKVFEAVVEGKPFIERIVALCGPCFKENIHVAVRIGTPLEFVLKNRLRDIPSRIVLNSLLTGFELNDWSLPVDKTFSQIIAIPENKEREFLSFARPGLRRDSYSNTFLSKIFKGANRAIDTNKHGEERPCISCGFCEEVCPVGVIPHLLSKYAKLGVIDETLMNYDIFNCIDCGLCSFVCPSKIPLLHHIREGQIKLTMQGCDRSQCILPYFNLKGIEEYRGVTKL